MPSAKSWAIWEVDSTGTLNSCSQELRSMIRGQTYTKQVVCSGVAGQYTQVETRSIKTDDLFT